MLLQNLVEKKLIFPPSWLPSNTHYLTIMGSVAYGVSSDTSDMDLYGFSIPPKDIVFPHLAGKVLGFIEEQWNPVKVWEKHGVVDKDALGGKGREYDFAIHPIPRYFHLLWENNPNMIDSIFTAQECVLHCTEVGNMVRDNRRIFLSKECYPRFKGYAYKQLKKMDRNPIGKRKALKEKFGFDVKFAYHLVRLLNECEQVLLYGDIDLRKNNEQLKAIRSGLLPEEDIRKWASEKELHLEKLFSESKLPAKPDVDKIHALLLQCMEHHYGSIDKCVVVPDRYKKTVMQMKDLLDKLDLEEDAKLLAGDETTDSPVA